MWEVPNVCQGYLSHDESCDQWTLKTDGVNLQVFAPIILPSPDSFSSLYVCPSCVQELCHHPESVELNRVYTNSIHSMAATYGIEAAATTIIRVSPSMPVAVIGMCRK